MRKIGILGGTFNPIHKGHIMLANEAAKEYGLDFVLIMPNGISYMKCAKQVLPKEHRGEMARLAIKDESKLVYDDRELKREGNSYTFETIIELKNEYDSDTEFYFITGADTLLSIHKWKKPEVIFNGCRMVVALRDGSSCDEMNDARKKLEEEYGARISFMSMEPFDVSSTDIRKMIADGESVRSLLPDSVFEYILKEKLYGIK